MGQLRHRATEWYVGHFADLDRMRCCPNRTAHMDKLAAKNAATRLRYEQLVASAQLLIADAEARLLRPTAPRTPAGDQATQRGRKAAH